jgi:DNA repair protein RadA
MSIFVCESCGTKHKKWIGKCEACGEWNTIVEEGKFTISGNSKNADDYRKIDLPNVNFINLPDQEHESFERITSGIDEFDRVLGGGFVPASAILIGGDPGIGKSTLLLQTCAKAAQNNVKVLYVSGEESVAQIAMRAKRLGFEKSNILLASANSIMSVLKEIEHNLPQMLIIDSIQTMFMANIEASPGSVSQIRATAMEIIAFCKAKGIIVIMVGHITKDGQIAGPKLLEHMVDVVIYFEGENTHNFRILRAVKNRFGSVNEIGLFAMQGEVNIRISMEQGIAGMVATTGQILNIPDAYENPNFNQAVDKKSGYRTKAILCMPIKADDQVIGVLQLMNKTTGNYVFTGEDEDVISIFLSIAGPILASSNLYAQIQGKGKGKGDSGSEMPTGKTTLPSKSDMMKKTLPGFAEGEDEGEEG